MTALTKTIRKISVRTMNRDFYKQVKDLPIIVEKNHVPFLFIQAYGTARPTDDATPPVLTLENCTDEILIEETIKRLREGGEFITKHHRRVAELYTIRGKASSSSAHFNLIKYLWQRIKKIATMRIA